MVVIRLARTARAVPVAALAARKRPRSSDISISQQT